jgi:hypothetical protein
MMGYRKKRIRSMDKTINKKEKRTRKTQGEEGSGGNRVFGDLE